MFKSLSIGLVLATSILPKAFAQSCAEVWTKAEPSFYQYDYKQDSSYQAFTQRVLATHPEADRKNCEKEWAVFIIMKVTKNLRDQSHADAFELEAKLKGAIFPTGSTSTSDAILQIDRDDADSIQTHYMVEDPNENFIPKTEAEVTQSGQLPLHSPIIRTIAKNPSDTQATQISEFFNWGVQNFRAKNYLFIIWGHGQGFVSISAKNRTPEMIAASGDDPGGVALDDKGTYLSIPELSEILGGIQKKIGKPIDILTLDACRMSEIEVCTELGSSIQYFCASQAIQSFAGLNYGALMRKINAGKHITPREIACSIPLIQKRSFAEKGMQSGIDPKARNKFTFCTAEQQKVCSELVPAVNQLGAKLLKYFQSNHLNQLESVKLELQRTGKFFEDKTLDIGNLIQIIQETLRSEDPKGLAGLEPVLLQTRAALNQAIIETDLGIDFDPAIFKGQSIWIPKYDTDYCAKIDDFKKSCFYKQAPDWDAFLNLLYNS